MHKLRDEIINLAPGQPRGSYYRVPGQFGDKFVTFFELTVCIRDEAGA
jgi:hypothetical protein